MSRQTFKFADWTTAPDPSASAEYAAFCRDVITREGDPRRGELCRWEFRILDDKEEADRQQKAHADKEGHRLFVETSVCPTIVTPPAGSVLAGRLARLERATR